MNGRAQCTSWSPSTNALRCERPVGHAGRHHKGASAWFTSEWPEPHDVVQCREVRADDGRRCQQIAGHTGAHKAGDMSWVKVDFDSGVAEAHTFTEDDEETQLRRQVAMLQGMFTGKLSRENVRLTQKVQIAERKVRASEVEMTRLRNKVEQLRRRLAAAKAGDEVLSQYTSEQLLNALLARQPKQP